MATIVVRMIAALFFSQSLYGFWLIWHYDFAQNLQIGYSIACLFQCFLAHRLWHMKRWSVVYMAVNGGIAVLVTRLIPSLGIGWSLYYLAMCISLSIVAIQEWKQLKSGF